jgi:ankyrin repeat protein
MKILKAIFAMILFIYSQSFAQQAQDIFDAVKNNDLAKATTMVERDTSLIDAEDNAGNTPLHHAAVTGSMAIADMLLSKGARINSVNNGWNTPLHEAVSNGKEELAKMLIEKGADIGKQNAMGNSPLHIAAQHNRKATAELLIAKGADLESKTISQLTPLNLLTLMTKDLDIAGRLIEKGADVNTKSRNGSTPLMNAAHQGSPEMIDLLLDAHADYDTANGGTMTMLTMASLVGSVRLFKHAVARGGPGYFQNESGNRALMRSALSGGSLEIVKILQDMRIPLSLEANRSGWTPLHYAAANAKPGMLEFLVRNGADINARTNAGQSAYNVAEENGQKEILGLILKLGGNAEPQKFPVLTGPYLGQNPPGNTPESFAPGIVSVGHSTVSTSPDGKEMYWNSGSSIMMTKIKDGRWTKPEIAPFSGKGTLDYYDDVPFVTPDNKKLFFMSMRPLGLSGATKENVWYTERRGDGWSKPVPVSEDVNALGLHWQISVSANGTLYFNGRDAEGARIRCSKLVDGKYGKPENLGIEGMSPFVSPDESYMIFARLISNRPVPFISYKSKNGSWQEPINLESTIGNGVCCIVSPDGKAIFVNGWWVDAKFIETLRPKE